jgi:PAS domain S-box-containing protein
MVLGAVAINQELRSDIRKRAVDLGRELAFGVSRSGSEDFLRFREEFTFSLSHLPYERLLQPSDAPSETLVPIRRFLSLNKDILRELIVIGPDNLGRAIRLDRENYFHLSPLLPFAPPSATADTTLISGLVQPGDGQVQARVFAVIDPGLFWRQRLTTFSLSHPDAWIHLRDADGRTLLVRHGGKQVTVLPRFRQESLAVLQTDSLQGYEGRLLHRVELGGSTTSFISAYMPLKLESWHGQLIVSADEQEVIGPAFKALALLAVMSAVLVAILFAIFFLFTRQSHRNQALIEDERRRIAAILNTVQSGILLVHEPSGRIVETNAAALRLIGVSAEELFDRRIDDFFLPSDDGASSRLRLGPEAESRFRDNQGRIHTVLANTDILQFRGTRYLLCSFVDVTPLKVTTVNLLRSQASLSETNNRLQEAICDAERSTRAAENANRAKSAFLAMMSHELRTPLNSILGLSESLIERIHGPLTEKQSRYLDLVVSSGRHLLDLINDILDLAKIESGRDDIVLTPYQLLEICENSLQIIQPMASRRRQTIETLLPPPTLWVRAEPRRLQQILVNLLSNAVKFTPEGGLLGLRVSIVQDEVLLAVWDRGIGIAADQIPNLFQPFVQLDARLARDYGGTGLGLALVKQLTALHRGRIEVISQPGEGSTFTLFLPLPSDSIDPLAAVPAAPVVPADIFATTLSGLRPVVLIAEDIPANIIALRDYLEVKGCCVETAANGREALDKTVALRPSVVLMDIQMPVLDGLAAIRLIRAHADPAVSGTAIIALTALAMPFDRDACMEAGVQDYVTKPASPRFVYGKILPFLPRALTKPA